MATSPQSLSLTKTLVIGFGDTWIIQKEPISTARLTLAKSLSPNKFPPMSSGDWDVDMSIEPPVTRVHLQQAQPTGRTVQSFPHPSEGTRVLLWARVCYRVREDRQPAADRGRVCRELETRKAGLTSAGVWKYCWNQPFVGVTKQPPSPLFY